MSTPADRGITRAYERDLMSRGITFREFEARHGLPSRTCAEFARSRLSGRHPLAGRLREALRAEGLDPERAMRRVRRGEGEEGERGRLTFAAYRGTRVAMLAVRRLGLSITELARATAVPRPTIHHLLSGYTISHKRKSSATAADERKARIAAFLKDRGATDTEMETLWEPAGTLPEDDEETLPEALRRLREEARPMLSQKVLDHFAVKDDPFTARFLAENERPFEGHHWVRAKARLRRAIERQEMVALVGPVGSGKSEMWREVERELEAEGRFRFVFLRDPTQERVTSTQIIEAILDEVMGRSSHCLSRQRKVRVLREQLAALREQDQVVTLVVEEGQLMPDENLRTFKGLNELYVGYAKLLGIVVIAQLQIHDLLRSQAVEEVRRRLPVIEFPGLATTEIAAYLDHRLGYVRDGAKRTVFDASALRVFEKLARSRESRDVICAPLALGNVAARAMGIAVERRGRKVVTGEDVEAALVKGDRA